LIRDEEIQRLINYIKGLGLKVTFSSKKSDSSALWYLDCSEIVVCKGNNKGKIDTVLSLVHELGHALHNIHEKNREVDEDLEDALDHVDEAEELGMDPKKRQRKIILNNEINGTKYWDAIYREVNLKFPPWRLEVAKEFDVYQYQVFYDTGYYPTAKERKEKMKELTRKHRT
jgi:hypothetical protein